MITDECEQALQSLPALLRERLSQIVSAPGFQAVLTAEQVAELRHQTGLDEQRLMLSLLPLAASFAVTPISQFKVGAVLKSESTGAVYFGANMEFIGVPLHAAIHAEQAAVNGAWLAGEQAISMLAVSAPPCGHCRQFLFETAGAASIKILLPDRSVQALATLLPSAFGPADLGNREALMHAAPNRLSSLEDPDPLAHAAWQAAEHCYAPYSQSYAGVALACEGGEIICGRYAESAAYNPSLLPLQSALSRARMAGFPPERISRCLLLQVAQKVDHSLATQSVLQAVAPDAEFRSITLR